MEKTFLITTISPPIRCKPLPYMDKSVERGGAMARNPVRFQKGLGLAEFNARYGREDQCHAALIQMRWPEGFVRGKCGERTYG
jgi:hypothetical protein